MTSEPKNECFPCFAATARPFEGTQTIKGQVNYLTWLAADGKLAEILNEAPSHENAIDWLATELKHPRLTTITDRYRQIAEADRCLQVSPVSKVLLDKILIPLHQAKASFVLGHAVSCIAMAGYVAEMLAIFRFQFSKYGSGPEAIDEQKQKRLFGESIENMSHSRRLGLFEHLGLINQYTHDAFKSLAGIRNRYIHRLSQDHDTLDADARNAYRTICALTADVLAIRVENGRLCMHAALGKYLDNEPTTDAAKVPSHTDR